MTFTGRVEGRYCALGWRQGTRGHDDWDGVVGMDRGDGGRGGGLYSFVVWHWFLKLRSGSPFHPVPRTSPSRTALTINTKCLLSEVECGTRMCMCARLQDRRGDRWASTIVCTCAFRKGECACAHSPCCGELSLVLQNPVPAQLCGKPPPPMVPGWPSCWQFHGKGGSRAACVFPGLSLCLVC